MELLKERIREAEEKINGNTQFVHRLSKPRRGSFHSFSLMPEAQSPCPPGHVRVAVDALGLNFRDVLIALNKYPDEDTPLGVEFAGRIIDADYGSAMSELKVFGVMLDSFADEVVLPRSAVAPYPAHLSPSVAAGLPVAYLAAWRGLVEMANLRPNQTLLVHHGSGGVGMAAIHLGHRIGARVIATAGTPQKRAHVRALGVEHVFGSRDEAFVDQVIEVTDGVGADVVIGALPPSLVTANLRCVSHTGHFVDMGKLGVPEARQIFAMRPGIGYSSMKLDIDAVLNPEWVGRTLKVLSDEIAVDALPILPVSEFCISEAHKAFRYMAKAQHLGKVVMKFPEPRKLSASGPASHSEPRILH